MSSIQAGTAAWRALKDHSPREGDPMSPEWIDPLLNAGVVLVAAIVGVLGLLWTNGLERRRRRQDSSDLAFSKLMIAIGNHAIRSAQWMDEPAPGRNLSDIEDRYPGKNRGTTAGGPLDVDLQTAADVTVMEASKRDRPVALQLAETLFHFKRALVSWQIARMGEVVGDIRKWKTGEIKAGTIIEKLKALKGQIEEAELARAER
jgi:hypothetical protein